MHHDNEPRDNAATVNGPYVYGKRFRVFVRRGGKQFARTFASAEEAEKFKAEVLKQSTGVRVSDAIDAFIENLRNIGLKDTSWQTTKIRLRTLMASRLDRPVSSITAARAQELYSMMVERPTRRGKPPAVNYCKGALAEAGTWARWCVKKGHLKADPFKDVTDNRRKRKGKHQLGIDEARKLTDTCLRLAEQGDVPAIAALCAFLLGLRASEVSDRQVQDIDDGGRIYVVTDAKTPDGNRRIEIPDVLQPHILKLGHSARDSAVTSLV